MNTVNIGPYSVDIHDRAGIVCSGGADSSILLYILMKYSTTPIHVYCLASKEKQRAVAKVTADVISKCMELTGNTIAYHHISYTDVQTKNELHKMPKWDLANKRIDIAYHGLTLMPPFEVVEKFKSPTDESVINLRHPETVKDHYRDNNTYYTPFANMNKQQIKELYDLLGLTDILFPITRSCESLVQSTGHCGECWWCEERQWAFGRLE